VVDLAAALETFSSIAVVDYSTIFVTTDGQLNLLTFSINYRSKKLCGVTPLIVITFGSMALRIMIKCDTLHK
jgi:hypothetical protein